MVGIHSTKEFAASTTGHDVSHNNLHFDGRAAPNLGIYNRVCHREAEAKRGYKFASVLINSCLGLQVIVAAALTAMGAANTNHVSITAFGAINTVIAGILTYLKGSGLPNRIRWYENEWKKVREYIEQRERDFSRPNCQLDVQEVVQIVEAMYEEVKADIQNNTPEAYISLSDLRNRGQAMNPQIPRLGSLMHGMGAQGQSRLQGLDMKYGHKVTDFLDGIARKEEERLCKMEGELEATRGKVVQVGQDAMQSGRDWKKETEEKGMRASEYARDNLAQQRNELERNVTATSSHVLRMGQSWEQDMEKKAFQVAERELEHARGHLDQGRGELDRGVEAARTEVTQMSRDLGHEVETRSAQIAEMQQDIEKEARHARDTAEQAQDGIHRAAAGFRGFQESMQRIGKAVNDELPQQKHS
ncbi:hypothetical protein N0V94_005723 [Neodidymelliopsis sp. IMI 364377]|nr:hypothetical protein N0V94_005723 [Neodidymelliopsis sp. IMI 364377]